MSARPWRFKSVSLSRLGPRNSRALCPATASGNLFERRDTPGPKNPVSVLMIPSMRTELGFEQCSCAGIGVSHLQELATVALSMQPGEVSEVLGTEAPSAGN